MPAFLLPPGLTSRALARHLAGAGALEPGPPRTTRRTFLDTFDWRLHRAGLLLEEAAWGRAPRLLLRRVDGGPPLLTLASAAPRFARELPPGALRDRVLPLAGPRALLPLAVAEAVAEPLLLRDRAGRPVARLSLESGAVGAPGADPGLPLPAVLVVPAGRRAAAAAALVAGVPGAAPAGPDALARYLAPLGRVPRDYSGKVRVALDPGTPARAALQAVLAHLLATMERNLPGLRADLDPEFLHDFRVAVRRSRCALGQVKAVLPAATAARFAREFRRLQEWTGPARDLDVYALELPALRMLLPPRARRSLGPLARLVERRRVEAHRVLGARLDAPAFERFRGEWRAFLERPSPRRPRGAPNAARPVREVAGERIGKLFRRALREGRAVTAASPAADLHELRKTCKKLRYLIEFFQSLYDPGEAAHFIDALKGLQDNLGRHQDLQVQAGELLGFARELARESAARPPAFLAMGMLVERLREEQAAERRAFAQAFGEFARGRNRRRLKKLLASEPPAASPGTPPEPRPAPATAPPVS